MSIVACLPVVGPVSSEALAKPACDDASMANPAAPESTLRRVSALEASAALLPHCRKGTSDRSICRARLTSRDCAIS